MELGGICRLFTAFRQKVVDATKAETEYTSVHRETDRDICTQVERLGETSGVR
jgi:hypothetical protein